MPECSAVKETMPLLLVESLDSEGREIAHLHIESCTECGAEWSAVKTTWQMMEDLPHVEVPARVREGFLAQLPSAAPASNLAPFRRRPAARWLAQAAAVALVAGGSYFAGHRTAPVTITQPEARVTGIQPVAQVQPFSIAESRVLPANALSPIIEGRPDIQNVQFLKQADKISVAFDVTSHLTVTGAPTDKSMVRLLAYLLQNTDHADSSRGEALEWVRQTYSNPATADPEIAQALARVLRSDDHEGVRIRAIDTLSTLPAQVKTTEPTRDALIEALKSDPNPAVRIKAVEALAKIASSGERLDPAAVDMLRQKASQESENVYIRVKAAEALSQIRP